MRNRWQAWWRRMWETPVVGRFVRLVWMTVHVCLEYRVTGLAAEAGFFAILSLPPLVLGMFGGVGYVGRWLGPETVQQVTHAIEAYSRQFLTSQSITDILLPTVDDVLRRGRGDLISVGFVLSLWSGSRALNVFIDTISIMYGQNGERGIIRTRALSFALYTAALISGIVIIPLLLVGPSVIKQIIPVSMSWLSTLYWPVVILVSVAAITSLFHVSTPRRSPWSRDIPGAAVTLLLWLIASYVVREIVAVSLGGTSIYGPLSAPIVLMIWLYFLAFSVLVGAAFNAAVRQEWPTEEERSLAVRIARWWRARRERRSGGSAGEGSGGADGSEAAVATRDDEASSMAAENAVGWPQGAVKAPMVLRPASAVSGPLTSPDGGPREADPRLT